MGQSLVVRQRVKDLTPDEMRKAGEGSRERVEQGAERGTGQVNGQAPLVFR
jgi:hypothetical protein